MGSKKTELMASFPKRLVEAMKGKGLVSKRAKLGVATRGLAEAIGCTRATVLKYTIGDRLPSYDKALLIASFLEVDVAWLLYGIEANGTEADSSKQNLSGDKAFDYGLISQVLEKTKPILSCGSAKDVIEFLTSFFQNASKDPLSEQQVFKLLDLAVTSAANFSSLTTSKHPAPGL